MFDDICSSRMRGLLIQHEVSTWHQVEPTSSVFLRPIQWGTYFMQGLESPGNLNVLLLARCLYIFIKFGIYAHLINLNMEKNSIKNTSPRTPSGRSHPCHQSHPFHHAKEKISSPSSPTTFPRVRDDHVPLTTHLTSESRLHSALCPTAVVTCLALNPSHTACPLHSPDQHAAVRVRDRTRTVLH